MPIIFDRRSTAGLLLNMGAAVLLACLANLFLLLLPESAAAPVPSAYEVPGPIVGSVWILLFAGLGAARWLLASSSIRSSRVHARWPLALLLFCAAYPLYTLGLRSLRMGLIGNVCTVVAAVAVCCKVAPASRLSALLTSLVAAWVSFATYLTIMQLRGL